MPSRLSSASAYIPTPPTRSQPLVRRPTASRRHFCAHVQQRTRHAKSKTSIKAIYRPVTPFCTLMAIPIFPHRKTPHRGRQRPAQGIKQPRPAPSGVSRGIIICSGPERAPRSAPPFGHTRRTHFRYTVHRLCSLMSLSLPLELIAAHGVLRGIVDSCFLLLWLCP